MSNQVLFSRSGIQQLSLDGWHTLHGNLIEDDTCGGSFARRMDAETCGPQQKPG